MKQFKNLKKFRQEYDLTQEELGKILNITKQSVWTLEKKDEIPLKYKQILEKKYNCEFIDEQQKQLIQQNSILDMTSCETSDIEADYYPEVFGSCGNGVFTLSETKERIKIPEKCFIKPISKVKKYSVINAFGDSMTPTINDKDRLIVEHFEYGSQIQDGCIYVFCYDNQIFVKRLYHNISEIIIKSDNPEFKTNYIQKEEMNNLNIIGQIAGLIRDLR